MGVAAFGHAAPILFWRIQMRGDLKPFKTVDEQIEILVSRNLIVEGRGAARRFLLRNNYYSLVNGYKEFFLDRDKTNESVEVYKDGTRFEHLKALYDFDTILRLSMMHCLTTAEKTLKTATVHAFCRRHPGPDDYLDPASYCAKKDYPGRDYTSNLIRLLSTLQGIHDGGGERRPYIEHYREKYHFVPLWVAANALTFGNMSHFYSLQKIGVQNEACHLLCQSLGRKVIGAKRLRGIYSTLTSFRNVCAHGGRLFCARAGRRGDVTFGDMLVDLSEVSEETEMDVAMDALGKSLCTLDSIEGLRNLVEDKMGLRKPRVSELISSHVPAGE